MRLPIAAFACFAFPAFATTPYDGVYRPDADWARSWSCIEIGSAGGAIAVGDGRLVGVQGVCDLNDPQPVRGLRATLYDAVCTGEGQNFEHRMLLMQTAKGIAVLQNGLLIELRRCDP